jgi:hypothetical protein
MSTAKIYKLECLTCPHIFIGATTKKYLSERITFYRQEYKRYLSAKLNEEGYKKYLNIKIESGNYAIIKLFKLFDSYNVKSFKILLLSEIHHSSPDDLKTQLYNYIKNTECINK